MAEAISGIEVDGNSLNQWNATFYEYDYVDPVKGVVTADTAGIDLETLTIRVANRRATVIESQVEPMSVRMNQRNRELDYLGEALADMSGFSAKFVANDDGVYEDVTSNISAEGVKGLALVGVTVSEGSNTLSKDKVDSWTQKLKTAMDSRNNATSLDMSRLESLVDRRDEAYSTSSSLSQKIAETRNTTIKNYV